MLTLIILPNFKGKASEWVFATLVCITLDVFTFWACTI